MRSLCCWTAWSVSPDSAAAATDGGGRTDDRAIAARRSATGSHPAFDPIADGATIHGLRLPEPSLIKEKIGFVSSIKGRFWEAERSKEDEAN
jgi:hypothetical protein